MDEYTSPEFSRSALLTIDLQRDFVSGIAGTAEILPAAQRLTRAFREAARPSSWGTDLLAAVPR